MTESGEQDLQLKLRMMRFLWSQGHFVRRNVSLEPFHWSPRRRESAYTDVDVFAVRTEQDLSQSITIVDCKSGATASTPERMFWLAGVRRYWNADRAYFIRNEMNEAKYADLGARLGLTAFSADRLTQLEKAFQIDDGIQAGPLTTDVLDKEQELFRRLNEAKSPLHNYLRIKYWHDERSRRVGLLMQALRDTQSVPSLGEGGLLFMTSYALGLFALNLLAFAKEVLVTDPRDRELRVRQLLMGGREGVEWREEVLTNLREFMAQEIQTRYREKYPVSKDDLIRAMYPDYTKYLVDLVERITLSPRAFLPVPRVFDLIAYNVALKGDAIDPMVAVLGLPPSDPVAILKAMKDVLTFAERSGAVPKERCERIRAVASTGFSTTD